MTKIRSATEIVDTNFPTKKYSAETSRLIKNVIKEARRQAIEATLNAVVDGDSDADRIFNLVNSKELKII